MNPLIKEKRNASYHGETSPTKEKNKFYKKDEIIREQEERKSFSKIRRACPISKMGVKIFV